MESSLYKQIYDLEDRLLQPEIRGSREEISLLLADDFVEFGVSSMAGGKWSFIKEPEQWSPASDIMKQ
ncbi:MAG: hypothetical protein M0Z35_14890 [Desulfitobacterium hafniense]|nr:hypothetical protein [Desulfitobacterium hafniense]